MKIATLSMASIRRLALSLALMVALGAGWSLATPVLHPGERTARVSAASHIFLADGSGVETHGGKGGGKHRTVSFS
jgi:hypothetical protein